MSLRQQIDQTAVAIQYAAERGDHLTAAELTDHLAELEQSRDARPGDFADDCCGDPSMTPVPGLLC
jgi:hypothetical protein